MSPTAATKVLAPAPLRIGPVRFADLLKGLHAFAYSLTK